MTPDQFVEEFGRVRVSAILRTDDQRKASLAMDAALRGGLRIVEFTLTTPGVYELIEEFSAREGVLVGAGTVLEVEQARRAVEAGASLLVSPVVDEVVISAAAPRAGDRRARKMIAPTRQLAAALLLVLLPGCPDPPAQGLPCDDDLTQCSDDTSKFVEDPSCELSGDLELLLGEGEDSFSPLAAGQLPQTYNGFQGGQHVWLGVRVVNADLERPLLKIRASMQLCDADCDDPASWETDNVREVVADSSSLTITSEAWFEVSSILIQVYGWAFADNRRVEVLVTDPCGRQGLIVREGS